MRIIDIALKDVLINLKSKRTLTLFILMPISLIFVLGMSLSSAFSSTGGNIKKFNVAIVDKDGGRYAKDFENFLNSSDIKKLIGTEKISYSAAEQKVKNGNIPAVLEIPNGYSKAIEEGKATGIDILEDPGSSLQCNIVKSLVKSYTGVTSSVISSFDSSGITFSQYNFKGNIDINKVMSVTNNGPLFKETGIDGIKTASSMQYYSAAILVMFVLFIAMVGTTSIIEEREQKTLLRLMETTVSRGTIILGKLLGLLFICGIEAALLILFTKYIFNTNWGNSLMGIIILSAALLFAVCGFAIFLAALFKTTKSANGATSPIVLIMSFLGGSMYPIYAMPDSMKTIASVVPNNWALNGYIKLMLGGNISSISTQIFALIVCGSVLLTAGIWKLKLD